MSNNAFFLSFTPMKLLIVFPLFLSILQATSRLDLLIFNLLSEKIIVNIIDLKFQNINSNVLKYAI